MPFTFSHPAIILPLVFLPRKWVSLTGLVIGSMTPDFEYFLRMRVQSEYSHTIGGLFWFDVPLGIILAFIFHNIVRNSLFDNLPASLRSRLVNFKQFEWNTYFRSNWFVVIISILIGASSHLFWDSFTHEGGYFTQRIPALTEMIEISGKEIPVLKILQHASTLIGGFLVVFALFKLPEDKMAIGRLSPKYWAVLVTLTLAIVVLRFLNGLDFRLYGQVIVTAISAGLISLTFTPWLVIWPRRKD